MLSYHGGYELFASDARDIAEFLLNLVGNKLTELQESPGSQQLIGGIKTILWTEVWYGQRIFTKVKNRYYD